MRLASSSPLVSLIAILLLAPTAANAQCPSAKQDSNTKVVHLGTASKDQWPWFAALRLRSVTDNEEDIICGGSAIAPNWVMTAAHCLTNSSWKISKRSNGFVEDQFGRRLELVLGVDNLKLISPDNVFEVEDTIVHEDYKDAESGGNDIALVKLRSSWKGPTCEVGQLSESGYSLAFHVAGFGAPSSGAATKVMERPDGTKFRAYTELLKQAPVVETDTEICKTKYSDRHATIGAAQICAGLFWNGEDSCQGDSGGPLVAWDRSTQCPKQVGIVSWGVGCGLGGRFGVYTRVSYYQDWIAKQIEKTSTITMATPSTRVATAVPPTLPELQQGLLRQLDDALAPAKGQTRLSVKGPSAMPVGRKFRFEVESKIAGRLILIDVDAAGKISQLYPNASTTEVIPANEKVTIPTPNMDFDYYVVTEPTGQGRLIALIVPEGFPYESLVAGRDLLDKGKTPEGDALPRIPIEEKDRVEYLVNLVQQVLSTSRIGEGAIPNLQDWGYDALNYEVSK